MRLYTAFRLAFAAFLLYVAWPFIPNAESSISKLFWASWLLFFFLVVGGNLATFLRLTEPPVMERKEKIEQRTQQGA